MCANGSKLNDEEKYEKWTRHASASSFKSRLTSQGTRDHQEQPRVAQTVDDDDDDDGDGTK